MNRILLLGGSGTLGSEVLRYLQVEELNYLAPSTFELDVRDKENLLRIAIAFKPNWIVNCTAWTNVEDAEDLFETALSINEMAVRNIAEVAMQVNSRAIHVSTDYVFDGKSSEPYHEGAQVKPLNKYGESKLRGEIALLDLIPESSYVIRTSWLYGIKGKSFVKTILGKALRAEFAEVVCDETGSPTSARDLAKAIIRLINKPPIPGIFHFSNQGYCTWFHLAQTIYEEVGADSALIKAISSSSLNLKAKRPKFSLLSKDKWVSTGLLEIPEWKVSLVNLLPEMVAEMRKSE